MSIEAMSWALSTPLGGNAKVVLIGLANHARPDFTEARPCVATLSRYAHCDERTVQRHLRKLEEDGWIRRTGWHFLGGRGDRKVAVYELVTTGRQNVTPQADGVTALTQRGDSADVDGVTAVSPEPSFKNRPRNLTTTSASGARELDWSGIPESMRSDAMAFLSEKRKVGTRIVTEREMHIAASALAEFNRQLEARFELGPWFRLIVERVRDHPSWDAAKHVRLVQSACRLKWWERNGTRRRAKPPVIWSAAAFPNVTADAANEAAARAELDADHDLSRKRWPDGRTFDQLTPPEQRVARDLASRGQRPWEGPDDGVPVAVNGNGNGHREGYTAANILQDD